MELNNRTPFVPFQFEAIDKQMNLFGVVVLRGTFTITNGHSLELAREQETLQISDAYFGKPGESSLRFAESLAPYKPKTDLLIEATAHSPSGLPEERWVAGVRAGDLSRHFQITGRRCWRKRRGHMVLDDIDPTAAVDIRYEHAYGGRKGSAKEGYLFNPVGVGRMPTSGVEECLCPQLLPEDLDGPVFGSPIEVVGLGPIAPMWQPRLARSGTFDGAWQNNRAPYLPGDFSYEFYNAAAAGLTFPGFARGDETVELTNLSEGRQLTFALPNVQLITIIGFDDGRVIPGPVQLDTIHLQVEERKAWLEWRGIFPTQIPVRAIEVRMSAPDSMIEG